MTSEDRNNARSILHGGRPVALGLVALLVAGCSGSSDPAPATTTTSTSAAAAEPSYPTAAQRTEIERAVATIYPGVPDGKAGDWAEDVCYRATVESIADEQLLEYVQGKFAGGTRPDPTPQQAAEILAAIASTGCPVQTPQKPKDN